MDKIINRLTEAVDVSKIIKDLAGDFSGSNEDQMRGIQLLKGLATSDDSKANAFMKKLDKATTKISKELSESVLDDGSNYITITEETYIPGADITLEAGDVVRVIEADDVSEDRYILNEGKVDQLLRLGGKEWKTGDKHRIYFNFGVLKTLIGFWFSTSFKNRSGIDDATIDGKPITNSKASRIRAMLSNAKVYYDVTTDTLHAKDLDDDLFKDIKVKIETFYR